jgi:hypothetical protein
VALRVKLMAARRCTAARLAEGWVLELSRRLPEILLLGAQHQPAGKVLFSAPAAHIRANLRNQLQRPIGTDAVDLAEVGAAGNLMQWRTQLHAWFVLAELGAGSGRRQLLCGWLAALRQLSELGVDGFVAVGDLALIELEGLKVLTQREQVFGAVIPGQRRNDLQFAGFATTVAMGRQLMRVAYPGQDVPHNRHAGYAGDVAEHVMQLEVHLGQGFLNPINAGGADRLRNVLKMTEKNMQDRKTDRLSE